MGYTSTTFEFIQPLLPEVKSVVDLGAQNNYNQPSLPAPYMSEWYKAQGIEYLSIDLNGENGSLSLNLDEDIKIDKAFDLVADIGTGEHCHDLYAVLKNMHNLAKEGGLLIRENPKTGNWPGHAVTYMTQDFYKQFCELAGYEILRLGENAAMGNITDGWNIHCIYRKGKKSFLKKSEFNKITIDNK
jgi:hypothetical protein